MSSSTINVISSPTKVNSGSPKGILAQNSVNGQPVYFSDNQSVTPTTGIQLLPGTPLEWPPDSELCISFSSSDSH